MTYYCTCVLSHFFFITLLIFQLQDPAISYDINEGDDDPFPRYDVSGKFIKLSFRIA